MIQRLKQMAATIPGLRRLYRSLRRWWTRPRWGGWRRTEPVSRVFGFDRGTPVDRHYIEQFLNEHRTDIQGRVLEIGDNTYTRRFGGERVTVSDVLHAVTDTPGATIVGDLESGANIPGNAFDCIILTQTLPFIYDTRAALKHVRSALKPGGVVLATVPGISQISRYDMERWGDFWRFTSLSARRLFEEAFGRGNVEVTVQGNVLAATAFLQGLAAEELKPHELDYAAPDYEVIITIRALLKNGGAS